MTGAIKSPKTRPMGRAGPPTRGVKPRASLGARAKRQGRPASSIGRWWGAQRRFGRTTGQRDSVYICRGFDPSPAGSIATPRITPRITHRIAAVHHRVFTIEVLQEALINEVRRRVFGERRWLLRRWLGARRWLCWRYVVHEGRKHSAVYGRVAATTASQTRELDEPNPYDLKGQTSVIQQTEQVGHLQTYYITHMR